MPATDAYLVDSSIYIFRAWFTLPDTLRNQHDEPINAVYGFTDFVAGLIEQHQPKRLVFAFDESLSSSFRNSIYPPYKANRDPTPDDLRRQFQFCRRFLEALGYNVISSDRYEADDIIGTAAAIARRQGHNVTILSADKDLAQLIDSGDTFWDYARDKRLDPKQIKKHYGVYPEQIADQLALAGDKIDNIPGVPGIGMTTAARLLTKFGSIDQMLENIPAIAEMKIRGAKRIMQLIQEHRDIVLLCKRLTEIVCDAEVVAEDLRLHRAPCQLDDLTALFDEFQFGSLRRERWQRLLAAA
jgi:5'-3' exonuclease